MYIRTKNRIYEVESTLSDNGFVKGYNVGEMAFIRKDQVIDQSENLEELCDELVIVYKDCCEKRTYLNKGTIEDFKKNHKNVSLSYKFDNPLFKYYGAIWTEKGLIYVAKMNEEGELVLI